MNVPYNTMEEAIGILKNNTEQTRQDWLDFFCQFLMTDKDEPSKPYFEAKYYPPMIFFKEEELMTVIDSVPALTITEIFNNYKGIYLSRALSFFSSEKIIEELDANCIDEYKDEYNTYKLYFINNPDFKKFPSAFTYERDSENTVFNLFIHKDQDNEKLILVPIGVNYYISSYAKCDDQIFEDMIKKLVK